MNQPRQWPLAVHIVYETAPAGSYPPGSKHPAEAFAHQLHSRLCHGDRATGVPVRLWRSNAAGLLPRAVPFSDAEKNLVVLLVDQALFESREKWREYIKALAKAKSEHNLILPVAVGADAARVASDLGDVNHIIVRDPELLPEEERCYQAIYTAILRLLVPGLPCVFLCHAKADGVPIASKVRQYLYEETQLSCFFDMHDIPHGHEVSKSIEDFLSRSVVLVVWTDRLLDSPWCQFEIIQARRLQRPMLVLDALEEKTPRLFPFLGNMPVVRWKANPGTVVGAILLELIRTHHLEAIFRLMTRGEKKLQPSFRLHPPDPLANQLAGAGLPGTGSPPASPRQVSVYPDPPLKPGELDIISTLIPGSRFLSLAEWHALRASNALDTAWDSSVEQRPNPLRGISIGISVSSSDDWAEIGLTALHQDRLAFELSLQLILLGAKVVWGGDLRPDGLGSQLKWIIQIYQHPSRPPQDHVAMFVPFGVDPSRVLSSRDLGERRLFADVTLMGCPLGEDFPLSSLPPLGSPETKAINALSLSCMRSAMAEECDARIVLGGGMRSFQGLYPGIVEEAYETAKRNRPLYVLAGYGGAADTIYGMIEGQKASHARAFSNASRKNGPAACAEMLKAHRGYVSKEGLVDFEFAPKKLAATFAELGLEGLSTRCGLSMDETGQLARSQDVHEILSLVVKGMSKSALRRRDGSDSTRKR